MYENDRGFTLIELIVVVVIIGALFISAIPLYLSYQKRSEAKGGADQVVAGLNQARQLAITKNESYRVEMDTTNNRYRFVKVSDSSIYSGPGTDSQGWFKLENNASISSVSANPVFSYIGAANTASTITVRNRDGTYTYTISVNSAGRIKVQ